MMMLLLMAATSMSIIGQREDAKRTPQDRSTNQLKRPLAKYRALGDASRQNIKGMFLH
jgi:hypothetical protein